MPASRSNSSLLAHLLCSSGSLPLDSELGILSTHSSTKGSLQLGTKGKLAHVFGLLLVQDVSLSRELLVLQLIESLLDGGEFGMCRVGRQGSVGGRGERWSVGVGAVAIGSALGGELLVMSVVKEGSAAAAT